MCIYVAVRTACVFVLCFRVRHCTQSNAMKLPSVDLVRMKRTCKLGCDCIPSDSVPDAESFNGVEGCVLNFTSPGALSVSRTTARYL